MRSNHISSYDCVSPQQNKAVCFATVLLVIRGGRRGTPVPGGEPQWGSRRAFLLFHRRSRPSSQACERLPPSQSGAHACQQGLCGRAGCNRPHADTALPLPYGNIYMSTLLSEHQSGGDPFELILWHILENLQWGMCVEWRALNAL